ncbi:MAG TPA: amidohydrolase family protein [Candidatus Aminicenantes bacterium]|nr:amidohydrolase family protein [Candidatus Aminicenantes bacterium]
MKMKQMGAGLILLIMMTVAAAAGNVEETFAVCGGRVVPIAGPEIENGVILVENGKIKAVGAASEISIPPGIPIIDAAGGWILPGLVDSFASAGQAGGDEISDPVTAGLRILDDLNPFDKRFEQTARAGITTLMIGPGRINVIGARTAVIKPRGLTAEDMVLLEPASIKISLGEGPKAAFGEKGRLPGTRMGSAYVVRKALLEAAEYSQKRRQAEAEKAAATRKKDAKPAAAPARNLDLEPLADLLEGKLPAFIECHRVDDIQTALRLVDEFGFRAVLLGAEEGWKIAGQIAGRNIPVVVGSMGTGPKREETKNVKLGNAAELVKAGVKVAIGAEDALGIGAREELVLSAALAVKAGLDRPTALRAVTLTAAEILGVASRVGSIEPGKDADLVIFTGDPLHYQTRVARVLIEGRPIPVPEQLRKPRP